MYELNDQEFARFRGFIYEAAGITLSEGKKALVSGRLEKRLRHHRVKSFGEYFELLNQQRDPSEFQIAVDLLTTNETYFFREMKHFELLREHAATARAEGRALRVWSAACSSGEEVYSIAMVLADVLGLDSGRTPWEVLGTDISTRVLRRAGFGHYPVERTTHIPPQYLQRFCLKGTGVQAGTLLVQRSLRERVTFMHANLDRPLPPRLGSFDLIFLRNVMIYFNAETKRRVVARLLPQLKQDGTLLIGHSETLNDLGVGVRIVSPSVYTKV